MVLRRLIEIGIDGRKARAGSAQVRNAFGQMEGAARKGSTALDKFEKRQRRVEKQSRALRGALADLSVGFASIFTGQRLIDEVAGFERQLVSVGKTTDIAGKELEELGANIDLLSRRLGTPTEQLADFARFAGQMGIRGVPQLTKFTETIARMGLTLDDLDPNEAAKELAQFLQITGRSDDDIFKLGNAVTKLGNEFRASEDQIVRSTTEIAKTLTAFDVGPELSLALGTTLATLRTRPELASTSINRAFTAIDKAVRNTGRELRFLAELSGVSSEEFAKAWREDQLGSLLLFLDGLERLKDQGGSVAAALEVIGVKGAEINRVIPPLASRTDVLRRAFEAANSQLNETPERLGEMQRESDRVINTFSRAIKRIQTTIASGGRAFANSLASTQEFKAFTDDIQNAIELIFKLEGALDGVTTRSKAFAIILKAVGLGLAFVIGLKAVTFFVDLGKAIFGVVTNLKTLLPLLGVAAVAMAALGSFQFGRYFYDEFRIVQETLAQLIRDFQVAAAEVKFFFKELGAVIKDAFLNALQAIAKKFADYIDDFVEGIRVIEGLFGADLGADALENFARSSRTIADDFNFAGVVREARLAKDEAVKLADDTLELTLKEIAEAFGEDNRRTGRSFAEFIADDIEKLKAEFPGLVDSLAQSFLDLENQTSSRDLLNLDDPNKGLKELTDNATAAGEAVEIFSKSQLNAQQRTKELVNELRIELSLIGKSNEARERAEKLQEFFSSAIKGYARDLDTANDALGDFLAGTITQTEFMKVFGDQQEKVNSLLTDYTKLLDDIRQKRQQQPTGDLVQRLEDAAAQFKNLDNIGIAVADSFESAFEEAFDNIVDGTHSVSDAFREMMRAIAIETAKQAVVQPISQILGALSGLATNSIIGAFSSGPTPITPNFTDAGTGATPFAVPNFTQNAFGNAFHGGRVIPFARGGVVGGTTFFPMTNGVGMMGERGPEAIMPLERDDEGNLGVRGGGPRTVVNMNIQTNDADSFRRSRRQIERTASNFGRRN